MTQRHQHPKNPTSLIFSVRSAWLLLLLVALAPIPTGAQANREHSVSDVVKSTLDSVVLIVVSDTAGKELKQGSGFIVAPDGKILTNEHVIEGAHSGIVKLSNGAFFPIQGVLASSKLDDLALIKVDGSNLPVLILGYDRKLSVGDRVIAEGSPLGLESSVSDGIVSAFRNEDGREWVQTTAPVSHGNSGGPLLDMEGDVVGVIALKLAGGENLNFALAIAQAKPLLKGAHDSVPLDSERSTEAVNDVAGRDGDRLWTSLTTGHDYRIRMDGEFIYTEWSNPPVTGTGVFMRSERRKSGEKWVGKTHAYLPFQYYAQVRWCSTETGIEISKVTPSRIEGRAESFSGFNARKCEPKGTEWKDFTWIPKK
jgi:hypothetical protein